MFHVTERMPRRDALNSPLDLFSRFIGQPDMATDFPAINLWADEDGAVLTSELPGVAMEDLDLTVSGKQVTMKGARKTPELEAEGVQLIRQERADGQFERSIQLPFNIEAGKVTASLKDGVLQVILPRAESDKPRKVAVSVTGS